MPVIGVSKLLVLSQFHTSGESPAAPELEFLYLNSKMNELTAIPGIEVSHHFYNPDVVNGEVPSNAVLFNGILVVFNGQFVVFFGA